MTRTTFWTAIAALCAPFCMGSDGCVHIAHHEYINTASVPGFFDVNVGLPPPEGSADAPNPRCDSDPFGLNTNWGIEHTLEFWIGPWDTVPASAWGTLPTGPARAAFPPQLGWFWNGVSVPSQIEVRGSSWNGQVYKALWYTTVGTWHPACAGDGRCPFLQIKPSINYQTGGNIDGTYDIVSGWQQGPTVCLNVWANRQLACHYSALPGFNTWPYCYLPSAADARFPPPDTGQVQCPPDCGAGE